LWDLRYKRYSKQNGMGMLSTSSDARVIDLAPALITRRSIRRARGEIDGRWYGADAVSRARRITEFVRELRRDVAAECVPDKENRRGELSQDPSRIDGGSPHEREFGVASLCRHDFAG
jgi:hypothetical protein